VIASRLASSCFEAWQVRSECDGESSDWSPLQSFEAGASEPTCDDGIQNGDETGVDCGGSDCPACPEPTCDDGIQNGNETGVDCGGDCAPCPEPSCDAPTDLSTSNIRRNKATLNWSAVGEAVDYTINVRAIGTTEWDDATTSNTSIVARPLAPSTTYEWRVRSNCTDETSEWSSLATFTTSASRGRVRGRSVEIDITTALTVDLYPNPASENLVLKVNRAIEHIEIMDLAGRTMQLDWDADTSETIELSIGHLASGTYFIRIQSADEVQALRFVKQ
ncbi:MAG: T9SS type A sorting domain-containing protein, partial [Bacteroidota bacterium]